MHLRFGGHAGPFGEFSHVWLGSCHSATPALPKWLPSLRVRGLRVGSAEVDLEFGAQEQSISVEVLRRTADLDVVVRL